MQPSHASSHFSKSVQQKICRVNTCATQRTASTHILHMPKPVITFVFKVLRNRLCFGTYFTHAQTSDRVRVQSATLRNGLFRYILKHMPKPVIRFVFKSATQSTASVQTLHLPKPVITVVCKISTQWTASVHTLTHAQTCDYVRVQSATQWTSSVHTLHMPKPVFTFVNKVQMPKPVIAFVLKVLRNGLLRTHWTASAHTLHLPKPVIIRSCSKCCAMGCLGTYFTHGQTCDYVRVQSATQWTASVHTVYTCPNL